MAWMLLQHPNEFPRQTIKSVRAFQVDSIVMKVWELMFELGPLEPDVAAVARTTTTTGEDIAEQKSTGVLKRSDSDTAVPESKIASTSAKTDHANTNLVKRNDYDSSFVCLGDKLYNAIKNQDAAYLKESEFTDDSIVQNGENWNVQEFRENLDTQIWSK